MDEFTHTLYADDSGSRDDTLSLTVAGFLASVEHWDALKPEWKGVLKEFGVTLFHAHSFATCKGEFASFKGKIKKQRRFIRQLVHVLSHHVVYGVAVSVLLADYKAVNNLYLLDDWYGGPFALCARVAIMWIDQWKEKHPEAKVKFIFEDGSHGIDALTTLMSKEGRRSEIATMKKQEHPALEAADFAAWERTRVLPKVIARRRALLPPIDESGVRKSLLHLWRMIPHKAGVETRTSLLGLCRLANVPQRKPPRLIAVK